LILPLHPRESLHTSRNALHKQKICHNSVVFYTSWFGSSKEVTHAKSEKDLDLTKIPDRQGPVAAATAPTGEIVFYRTDRNQLTFPQSTAGTAGLSEPYGSPSRSPSRPLAKEKVTRSAGASGPYQGGN